MLYQRVTPKYVIVYEPLNCEEIKYWYPGMRYRKIKLGCLYINRKTHKITDRHMSTIERDDVNKFLDRNKPIDEMEEGADLIAKLLLRDGSML